MKRQEFINQAMLKLSKITDIESLKKEAIRVNDDLSIPGIILDAILGTLEGMMSEQDFIQFCEGL